MPNALLVLSSGIGNVIRWTPMIRVLHALGYEVDVWLVAPDYPDVEALIADARWIRMLHRSDGTRAPSWMVQAYDVAVLTRWVPDEVRNGRAVRARQIVDCPREFWLQHGDRGAVAWSAVQLGHVDPIPPPFVAKSSRTFDLNPRTIAIHAGRKAGWEQKQWSYFGELIREFTDFANVVVVGAERDQSLADLGRPAIERQMIGTAEDYVGKLSLADTAALLSQCQALVSTDSGLSHVAAALPILTFPIYGITKPKREAFALPHVFPIENRSVCAGECATIRYNARTCPGELACLRMLSAAVVAAKVKPIVELFLEVDAHNAKIKARRTP